VRTDLALLSAITSGQPTSVQCRLFNERYTICGKYVCFDFDSKQPKRIISNNEPLIFQRIDRFVSVLSIWRFFVEDTFSVHIDDTELNVQTF